MSKNFLIAFGIGIGVIALAIGGVFVMQRGAHVELAGKVLKVRTAPLDENSSVAVIDFRFSNPSSVRFVVRTVTVLLEEKNGGEFQGATVSEMDAKALFQVIPLLGQKFSPTLLMGDSIPSHASEDRMVAARFEAPESRLDARKEFVVRIEDVDGPVTDITERQ